MHPGDSSEPSQSYMSRMKLREVKPFEFIGGVSISGQIADANLTQHKSLLLPRKIGSKPVFCMVINPTNLNTGKMNTTFLYILHFS